MCDITIFSIDYVESYLCNVMTTNIELLIWITVIDIV